MTTPVSRYAETARWREFKLTALILLKSPLSLVGLILVAALIVLGLFGELLAPYDPYELSLLERLQGPSGRHLLGTDALGRDVFSRLLAGARNSLFSGAIIVGIGVTIGGLVGLTAGYISGRFGEMLMRIVDIFLAFPTMVLAIAFSAIMGPSLWNALLAMSLVYWPRYARLFYGQTLSVRQNEYISFARFLGVPGVKVIFRHVLPNVFPAVFIQATLDFGDAILLAAALGFLGLGAQPPSPDWGLMISDATNYLNAWWMSVFPGLAIFLSVLGFNLLGDGLRDALDPTLRRGFSVEARREG